ncbi:MAG: hypothetical protein KBT12_00360 [Bacteroidales bacterium]|nr:hypothetical protein [Candidatus Physcousia equi]
MKTVLKLLGILIIAAFLVWSFIGIGDNADERVCTGMELEVEDSLSLGLINREEVLDIMKQKKMTFEGKKIMDINLSFIEQTLSASPYIDTAMCAFNAAGKLHLSVVPKIPTLHVIADNGEEYYIDRRGDDMPVGNITGNISIASGKITKDFAKKHLAPLACCIQDSTFWRAQVQQIEVCGPKDVRLHTRFADHTILLGEPTNIPNKLWRMRVFYAKALPETGWNHYKTINVAFDDIVIGKKE